MQKFFSFVFLICLAFTGLQAQYFQSNTGQFLGASSLSAPTLPAYTFFTDYLTLLPGANNNTVLEINHGAGVSGSFKPSWYIRFYLTTGPGYYQYLLLQTAPGKWQTTNTYMPAGVYFIEIDGWYECPNGAAGDTAHIWIKTLVNGNVVDASGYVTMTLSGTTCNPLFFDQTSGDTVITTNTTKEITAYPNPTSGVVNIEGEYEILRISDMQGKLISQYGKVETLDLSSLAPGVYILTFITLEGEVKTKRIVKN